VTNKDKTENVAQVTEDGVNEAAGGRVDQMKGNFRQTDEKVRDAFKK
jgi:hypothetical protein